MIDPTIHQNAEKESTYCTIIINYLTVCANLNLWQFLTQFLLRSNKFLKWLWHVLGLITKGVNSEIGFTTFSCY